MLTLASCLKDKGSNPDIAYSDRALLDSARQQNFYFYKEKDSLLSGAGNSPHGSFKLRFNSVAFKALTASGKLPANGKFPEGSMVVKDIYKNGSISLYAYMYKRKGGWLWGEAESNGKFLYTQANPAICIGCHNQAGNRDHTLSFNYH